MIFVNKLLLTLSSLDGPYGPMPNILKINFAGGKVQNIVNVLMEVFYNSLRLHLTYLTMLPPVTRRFLWFLTVQINPGAKGLSVLNRKHYSQLCLVRTRVDEIFTKSNLNLCSR